MMVSDIRHLKKLTDSVNVDVDSERTWMIDTGSCIWFLW
jgi:hypothetical protein